MPYAFSVPCAVAVVSVYMFSSIGAAKTRFPPPLISLAPALFVVTRTRVGFRSLVEEWLTFGQVTDGGRLR